MRGLYAGIPRILTTIRERGALGSEVIAGGVKMKLLAICFARTRVPIDCLPAAIDDRVGWREP